MRFRDPQSKPLWVEQGDDIYGHTLTSTEFLAEELEARPSLRLLQGGRSSTSPAHGVDRSVTPLHRTRPADTPEPSSPSAGPNFPREAA